MARSDHGKSKSRTEIESDNEQRGPIGPMPKLLSGYHNWRCRQYGWYWNLDYMNGEANDNT